VTKNPWQLQLADGCLVEEMQEILRLRGLKPKNPGGLLIAIEQCGLEIAVEKQSLLGESTG
jgi:hypothetical protein